MTIPTLPPRWDGVIPVQPEEIQDARAATEDVTLVNEDDTLTEAGVLYVADVRRAVAPDATPRSKTIYVVDEPVFVELPREGMSDEEIGNWLDANRPSWKTWGQY